jgi:hypothetical protein
MHARSNLSTVKGSGTSGFVQRNLAAVRTYNPSRPHVSGESSEHYHHRPDPRILAHKELRIAEDAVNLTS